MPAQPPHTIVTPPSENRALFNPTVPEIRTQYGGHIGHYWTTLGIRYNGSKDPGDMVQSGQGQVVTEQWSPEVTNQQYIALVTGIHGQLWGDVHEFHRHDTPGQLGGGWQPTFLVPPELSPRFYPDGATTWADCDNVDGFGQIHPLCPNNLDGNEKRYTGTPGKPYMIRQRGTKLWVLSATAIGTSQAGHGHWNVGWGGVLRVADITETAPAYPDSYSGQPMLGTRWETRWERTDFDMIYKRVGPRQDSQSSAAPRMPASQFGVGIRYLVFIDDATYTYNDWPEHDAEVVIVDPYWGRIAWQFESVQNNRPESDSWKIPRRVAPRDAPWCVAVTGDHDSIWIGIVHSPFMQDNSNEEILMFEDHNPVLADANIEPWLSHPPTDGTIIPQPWLIAEGYEVECRGYDRQPGNDFRGAVDAVVYHTGYSIKDLGNIGGGDHAFYVDSFKTRHKSVTRPAPPIDGTYLWRREMTPDNSRTMDEWTIDLRARHGDPMQGHRWVPIAITLTPYGDPVYVMISDNSKSLDQWPQGRRFLIARYGHWEINTRVPRIEFDNPYTFPEFTLIDKNYYGDLVTEERMNWSHTERSPIKATCNEHWLYLTNFPQRATPTYDLRQIFVPTPDNFVHDSFQQPLGFNPDGSNLGTSDALERDLPLIYKTNVFWEWAIDLYSGEVRVPFRTQYGGRFGLHSFYGADHNFVRTVVNDLDIYEDTYDEFHQNGLCFANTDTPPTVYGVTPQPTFH
jgi:hypothetical protein